MKIPRSVITRLNFRYASAVDVHGKLPNESRAISDNVRVFIDREIRKGSAISLVDFDIGLSEKTFWDIEHFESFCENIYFTFKPGFITKLIRLLPDIDQEDIHHFYQLLKTRPVAYTNAIDHPEDPYLHFIGKKIQSLEKTEIFKEVIRLDKANRQKLLNALQQHKLAFKNEEVPSQPLPTFSFSEVLQPIGDSVASTKSFIQQQLKAAEIPFELIMSKPILKTRTNKNPDGFNGALAAMITVFKDLGYFKPGLTFSEILDAYLQETGNTIGKLSAYKRNYFRDNYYLQYKKSLEELEIKKLAAQS
ncbi:hypothetical protein ABDK00_018170 [Niabella insulamsoli]|uniref:hypothetical protein n=1 Tax=Niabella insulamsoli TaxID=3144874 RepID=UPI0031FD374F